MSPLARRGRNPDVDSAAVDDRSGAVDHPVSAPSAPSVVDNAAPPRSATNRSNAINEQGYAVSSAQPVNTQGFSTADTASALPDNAEASHVQPPATHESASQQHEAFEAARAKRSRRQPGLPSRAAQRSHEGTPAGSNRHQQSQDRAERSARPVERSQDRAERSASAPRVHPKAAIKRTMVVFAPTDDTSPVFDGFETSIAAARFEGIDVVVIHSSKERMPARNIPQVGHEGRRADLFVSSAEEQFAALKSVAGHEQLGSAVPAFEGPITSYVIVNTSRPASQAAVSQIDILPSFVELPYKPRIAVVEPDAMMKWGLHESQVKPVPGVLAPQQNESTYPPHWGRVLLAGDGILCDKKTPMVSQIVDRILAGDIPINEIRLLDGSGITTSSSPEAIRRAVEPKVHEVKSVGATMAASLATGRLDLTSRELRDQLHGHGKALDAIGVAKLERSTPARSVGPELEAAEPAVTRGVQRDAMAPEAANSGLAAL